MSGEVAVALSVQETTRTRSGGCALWILGATLLAVPYVLFSTFNGFSWFDDEGTLLMWFHSLRDGHRMYDEIYNLYGPLYSAVYGFIYGVIGLPLTHTAARLIAATLWLSYTACFAVLCFRLTRSLAASVLCYTLVLIWLTPLMDSPGHPEEMCLLLLGLALLGITSIERRRNAVALASVGIAIGGLTLVKINVGAFVGGGALLALLAVTMRTLWVRIALYAATAALLLLPIVVCALLFDFDWARIYCLFSVGAVAAALLLFSTSRPAPIMRAQYWWVIIAAGTVIGIVAVGGMMAAGSSVRAIFDAAILQNAQFVRNWYLPMRIGVPGLISVAVSLALSVLYVASDARPAWRRHRDYGVLALKAGFVVLGFCFLAVPALAFIVLSPFCWLVMAGDSESRLHAVTTRRAVGLIGATMSLYSFPVAGHQVNIATLLPIAMIPVLLDDVARSIQQRDAASRVPLAIQRGVIVLALIWGLAGTVRAANAYLRDEALDLPGTGFIRVAPRQAEDLRWVTAHVSSCASSYTIPGLLSFAFWSGHFPPTATNVNAVLNFVSDARQEEIVQALSRERDLCIVYNPTLLAIFDRGQIEKHPPLLRYIQSEFVSVAERNGYIILRRRD